MLDLSITAPKQIILINGPPRSGKDTFANILFEEIKNQIPEFRLIFNPNNVLIWGFSWHLKQMVHTIYLGEKGFNLHPNAFEDVKDQPQEILDGMSWRQAYIYFSENCIKTKHGKQWFGKMFLKIIEEKEAQIVLVPDSGFYHEALPIIDHFKPENCRAIQMHRTGTDFYGDSRSYIDLTDEDVPPSLIYNDGSLVALQEKAFDWLRGK